MEITPSMVYSSLRSQGKTDHNSPGVLYCSKVGLISFMLCFPSINFISFYLRVSLMCDVWTKVETPERHTHATLVANVIIFGNAFKTFWSRFPTLSHPSSTRFLIWITYAAASNGAQTLSEPSQSFYASVTFIQSCLSVIYPPRNPNIRWTECHTSDNRISIWRGSI